MYPPKEVLHFRLKRIGHCMEKKILSGNEAIARGAYEAGVNLAVGYPGTPSTEILENMSRFKDEVYCEWSPNEKVAFEVAAGASLSAARCLVTMKHVGLNVAADPLMTLAYTGVVGGFVACVADDPACIPPRTSRTPGILLALPKSLCSNQAILRKLTTS